MDPTIFIAVTTAAVVLQALILVALYLAVRKVGATVESLASEVKGTILPKVDTLASEIRTMLPKIEAATVDIKDKVVPTVSTAHSMLLDLRPKIASVSQDISSTTAMVRAQAVRIDATLTDAMDRAHLQIIRADHFVNHTMDRIEETGDIVRKTVVSPVRQVSGLVRGVSTGFEVFFGSKRRRHNGNSASQEEMFI